LIDESEQVKAAKAAIDAWQEKGTSKGFDLHVKRWDKTEAHAEMTALAVALTPEEEIKYTFEFSVEEAITMPNFPPILEEAPKPPPIVEKRPMSYEPMSGVGITGFSVGDEIECDFPSYYDKSDRREAKNDYPWGERGEIIGFREDIGIGNRKSVTAIVRFDSGVTRQIFEDMMTVTNTDF
jgi:hypothetical protein